MTFPLKSGFQLGTSDWLASPVPEVLEPARGVKGNPLASRTLPFHCQPPISLFNAFTSYQLPFGNGQRFGSGATGAVDKLIGGWQWNGSVRLASGFPFTPLAGSNISGTGDASQSDAPSWNPDFKGKVIVGKPDQWYDPRAFVLPLQGTFGNVGRGSLRGPGLFTLDTSLLKRVRISEGLNLQFRAEAFNVLNHTNLGYPNEVVFQGADYSPTGGVITATATPSRQIQFALKLQF